MNTLIFVLASFAVALALGLIAMDDPGYVLISRVPYEVEVSLALFVLVLVLIFTGLYLLVRFLLRLVTARRDVSRWNERRNRARAGRDILHGYARLIEGDFAEAERELTVRLAHSDTPLLNQLGAAYAAQQQGDFARRDAYLDAAAAGGRRFRDAVSLTRARLQYQAGQVADARATIESMPSALRRRHVVQRMEAEVLRSQEDFKALEKRLPYYRRHDAFSREELGELEQQTYGRVLRLEAPTPENVNELTRAFSSLPESARHEDDKLLAYVAKLVEGGQVKRAADVIRNEQHHHWHAALVPVFAGLDMDAAEKTRQMLVWLERHPEEPLLLYHVAHLKNAAGDAEAAQGFYVKAIRHGAGARAYLELGELLERAGEHAEAMRCYKRGLQVRGNRGEPRPQSSTANSKES